jgi:hypothetical protein
MHCSLPRLWREKMRLRTPLCADEGASQPLWPGHSSTALGASLSSAGDKDPSIVSAPQTQERSSIPANASSDTLRSRHAFALPLRPRPRFVRSRPNCRRFENLHLAKAKGSMTKAAMMELQQQIEDVRREAYAAGYAAVMQMISDATSRPPPKTGTTAAAPGRRRQGRARRSTPESKPTRPRRTGGTDHAETSLMKSSDRCRVRRSPGRSHSDSTNTTAV